MFQLTYITFFHPFPSKNIKIRPLFLAVSFSQNQGNQNGQQKKKINTLQPVLSDTVLSDHPVLDNPKFVAP